MKLRVYYEDTDAGGIVYHSNYLNFCERARSDAFFKIDKLPYLQSGHFVAKRIEADYIRSAKLGDLLEVKTELMWMKSASFLLKQSVFKEDVKLFEMQITLAYITFEGRAQRMDEETKELVSSLFHV